MRVKLLALAILLTQAAHGASFWRTITFRRRPSPVRITTTMLPVGDTGVLYSTALAASGGHPPYSWSATSLPTGFVLSANGALAGTSAAVVNAQPSFVVRDRTGGSNSLSLALAICAPLKITITAFPPGQAGVPYLAPLTASGGGASVVPPACVP